MAKLDLGKVVPEKGTDYFTTADKQEMENEIISEIDVPKKTSDLQNDSGFINKDVNNLSNYELKTNTGSLIALSIDSSNYVITMQLKNSNGTVISTGTVDLPLESVVVSGRYDNTTKKVILTLENGNEVDFSVADLVSGLQSEITSTNKLASDLIDDSNSGNKFVTTSEKNTWNAKLDSSDLNDYVKNTDYATSSKAGIVKVDPNNYGISVNENGVLYARNTNYYQYQETNNNHTISKGTLEAVIAGKQLVNQTYVDNIVGNISTLLENLVTVGGGE